MANVDLNSLKFPGLSDTYVIPSEVYWATYGTTTSAQLHTAYTAGKVVLVNATIDGETYTCRLTDETSENNHVFTAIGVGVIVTAECSFDNWSATDNPIALPQLLGTPQPLGTAAQGSSNEYSRADHVHAMPSAANVGAIAAPSSPATGAFLVYNGSAWVAQTLATWQGGSY